MTAGASSALPAGAGTTSSRSSSSTRTTSTPGEHHGGGGEWRVEHPRMRWAVLDAFADAAEAAGIPQVADFNTGDNTGVGYFQVNQKTGRRWSAASALPQAGLKRPNLKLETRAMVEHVVMQNNRAIGVAWSRERQARDRASCLARGGLRHPRRRRRADAQAARTLRHRAGRAHQIARPRSGPRSRPASAKTCRTISSCARSTRSPACPRSTSSTPRSGDARSWPPTTPSAAAAR